MSILQELAGALASSGFHCITSAFVQPEELLHEWTILCVCICALLLATPALATTSSVSDTDDDATLTLTAENEYFIGVTVDWCEVTIQVVGIDVAFSSGDQVTVRVYEDDVAGDDLLFETTFTVTASEVANQLVDRTFNCSADLILFELPPTAEVYAEALVNKSNCGFLCLNDDPMTPNLFVTLHEPVPVSETTWGAVKALYGKEGSFR